MQLRLTSDQPSLSLSGPQMWPGPTYPGLHLQYPQGSLDEKRMSAFGSQIIGGQVETVVVVVIVVVVVLVVIVVVVVVVVVLLLGSFPFPVAFWWASKKLIKKKKTLIIKIKKSMTQSIL